MQRIVAILLTLSLTLAGCTAPTTPIPSEPPADPSVPHATPMPISPSAAQLVAASNRFGFELLQQLSGTHQSEAPDAFTSPLAPGASPLPLPTAAPAAAPDKNIFLSPLSLSLALQMTHNGADGETAAEMASVLHIADMEPEAVNQSAKELQDNLRAAQSVELAIGNSLWLREGWQLDQAFVEQNRNSFDATLEVLDFNRPEAVERINQWAEEATQGKIDKVLEQIEPDVFLFLLNAIYFKGDWLEAFDPARTQPMPFRKADGASAKIPMMLQTHTFSLLSGDGFQAVALPYQGERVRMLIFLPDEDQDLNGLLSQITPAKWQTWLADFERQKVTVGLPRFKATFSQKLNKELKSLGMTTAFDWRANFLPMFPEALRSRGSVYIDYVKHDAVVEVNEEGTVAAAVTTVAMADSAPPSFIVDRPFFLAIVDDHTGTILFLGAIVDPEPL